MLKIVALLVFAATFALAINFFTADSSAKSAFETIQKRCTSKQVQKLKADLLDLTVDKIGKPKKEIDGKVAKAKKRYQNKIIGKGITDENIEAALADAVLKKTEVESKLQGIINSVSSIDCENKNNKKQEIHKLYTESFNLLEEYKQLKNLLVQLVNEAQP